MPETKKKKDRTYYRALAYPCEVIPSREGGYVTLYPDLPGCAAQGDNLSAALAKLAQGRELWIRSKLEAGESVPEPHNTDPSGRLMLRVPIRLHARLERLAPAYNLSLNRLLNELLFNHVQGLAPEHRFPKAVLSTSYPRLAEEGSHYSVLLTETPGEGFLAEHPDLPGCFSFGDDPDEAMKNLEEAQEIWLQEREQRDLPVPAPQSTSHTGMIHFRMPPDLHGDLSRAARRDGVSLNQFLGVALAEALGRLEVRDSLWRKEIPRVIEVLRQDSGSENLLLSSSLPESCLRFFQTIVSIEKRDFDDALRFAREALETGLDFSSEAVDLYALIPDPLSLEQLSMKFLELVHHYSRASQSEEVGKLLEFRHRLPHSTRAA